MHWCPYCNLSGQHHLVLLAQHNDCGRHRVPTLSMLASGHWCPSQDSLEWFLWSVSPVGFRPIISPWFPRLDWLEVIYYTFRQTSHPWLQLPQWRIMSVKPSRASSSLGWTREVVEKHHLKYLLLGYNMMRTQYVSNANRDVSSGNRSRTNQMDHGESNSNKLGIISNQNDKPAPDYKLAFQHARCQPFAVLQTLSHSKSQLQSLPCRHRGPPNVQISIPRVTHHRWHARLLILCQSTNHQSPRILENHELVTVHRLIVSGKFQRACSILRGSHQQWLPEGRALNLSIGNNFCHGLWMSLACLSKPNHELII